MLDSNYKLKITGKDCKRFINFLIARGIYFKKLEFKDKEVYIRVDEKNYNAIREIKTTYDIRTVKLYGAIRIKDIIKRYSLFFVSTFIGLLFLLFLSNIILKVEVIHNKKEIRDLVYSELTKHNIKVWQLAISFTKQEQIAKIILEDNKTKIEWLEIERIGTKYVVRVEERIINEREKELKNRHIVARKNGIITKVLASKGEIVKKTNNYVRKGDIIVSGIIKKNEQVVNVVPAVGTVYAEVWYIVEVSLPKKYYEEQKTGRSKNVFSITILNKEFNIFDFDNYKGKQREVNYAIQDPLGIIKIGLYNETELNIIDETYTTETASTKIEEIAIEKIKTLIDGKGKIISQKKLKTVQNNSTIDMKVFFKVEEDITDFLEIIEEVIPPEE